MYHFIGQGLEWNTNEEGRRRSSEETLDALGGPEYRERGECIAFIQEVVTSCNEKMATLIINY